VLNTLIVSGAPGTGAERYRVFHRREQLELMGQSCAVVCVNDLEAKLDSLASMRDLTEPYDLVLFHRTAYSELIGDWLETIAALGKPAVFDVDDLVFEPGLIHHHRGVDLLSDAEKLNYQEGVQLYLRMLKRAPYFIGATDLLADLAQQRGRKAYVDRNALSLETVTQAAEARRDVRTPSATLTIGYASGTHTHNHDFLEAADALLDVLKRYPDVRVCLFGPLDLDARFEPFKDRIDQEPLTAWFKVPHVMSAWDINLAPLEMGNPFCRSKSELKYFEGAVVGLPTVASRIDAFEVAIEDGRNGFLCSSPDEWRSALSALIEQPELRRRMGAAAEADAFARYAPEVRAAELVALLERIVSEHREGATRRSSQTKSLKIGWVLPAPFAGSGGHMTIFRNVRYLEEFGHHCQLYFENTAGRFRDQHQLASFLRETFIDTGADVRLGWEDIEPCDALFATHWSTAHIVSANASCLRKLYFVQDFEPYFYPMGSEWVQAEQTYRLGLGCITIGRWLTHVLRARYEVDADFIDFAVDTRTYAPKADDARRNPPTVCVLAQPEKPRRGFALLVQALERVHHLRQDARIVLYGSSHIPAHLPFPFENAGLLSVAECAELYNRSHVGVILSMSNPSLIGFEMMACKCAVVDLGLENNRFDYGDAESLTLAKPDPVDMAGAIVSLLNDTALRQRRAESGYRFITERSYESSARRLEHHILRRVETDGELGSIERRDLAQVYRDGIVGEITSNRPVAQSFRCSAELLCRVDILLATYNRANKSRLRVSLHRVTASGPELASLTVPAASIRDNGWLQFEFEPIDASAGRNFVVVISSPDASPGDAITAYCSSSHEPRHTRLRVGGEETRGALTFRTYCLRDPDNRPLIAVNGRNDDPAESEAFRKQPGSLEPADHKLGSILRSIRSIAHQRNAQIRQLQHIIHTKEEAIHHLQSHLNGIMGSRRWRAINMMRRFVGRK
jgi:glycosyltransferase involved in cell wall biosynthesis